MAAPLHPHGMEASYEKLSGNTPPLIPKNFKPRLPAVGLSGDDATDAVFPVRVAPWANGKTVG